MHVGGNEVLSYKVNCDENQIEDASQFVIAN